MLPVILEPNCLYIATQTVERRPFSFSPKHYHWSLFITDPNGGGVQHHWNFNGASKSSVGSYQSSVESYQSNHFPCIKAFTDALDSSYLAFVKIPIWDLMALAIPPPPFLIYETFKAMHPYLLYEKMQMTWELNYKAGISSKTWVFHALNQCMKHGWMPPLGEKLFYSIEPAVKAASSTAFDALVRHFDMRVQSRFLPLVMELPRDGSWKVPAHFQPPRTRKNTIKTPHYNA